MLIKSKFFTTILGLLFVSSLSLAQVNYVPPAEGWTYFFDCNTAEVGDTTALDGTYDATSASWDGTAPGEGMPGGVGVFMDGDVDYLRIQDPGDPRDLGLDDPSNRKLPFIHGLYKDGVEKNASILDDGITLAFRARIPTTGTLSELYPNDATETAPYPEEGDGYELDGGYGLISLVQTVDGAKTQIGFTFMTSFDHDTVNSFGGDGLFMNCLNGNTLGGEVGFPPEADGVTVNAINLDPKEWHEFWIQIAEDTYLIGTHTVKIWKDGEPLSTTFYVTGDQSGYRGYSYLWLGMKNTGDNGAIDIDYVAYKEGLVDPTPATNVENEKTVAANYQLYQNYPNPFNPSTTISFNLKKTDNVTLLIYNLQGQVIETLVDERLSAGLHTISFDSENLTSGIYLYKIKTSEFEQMKKMTIVK